jgi:MFS family permease
VNVSFAQLQLEDDLGFSDTIFGLGAGIFSIGYVLFGVPSNLALARFGARRWLASIMIVWGVLSAATMFIDSPESFYVLRFLLGVAEAGFFPGIVLYLTWWFPEQERARALALFMTAISVSYVLGGPVSGGLLELDGLAGLDGWQWLFLCEGLPAVALGFVTLSYLSERPRDAGWLEPAERTALGERMELELRAKETAGSTRLRDALGSGQVWLLSLIYFILLTAGFGLTFFAPDLVDDRTGFTDFEIGVLSAIPFAIATAAMLGVARRADRRGRRRPYVVVLPVIGAAGVALSAYAQSPFSLTIALTLATVGILGAIPVFWALPTGFLTGTAAAGGIALIAALGNLGGFAGPAFTGAMEDSTGDFKTPFVVLAALLVAGSLLTLLAREERPAAAAAEAEPEAEAEAEAEPEPAPART